MIDHILWRLGKWWATMIMTVQNNIVKITFKMFFSFFHLTNNKNLDNKNLPDFKELEYSSSYVGLDTNIFIIVVIFIDILGVNRP